MTSKKQALVRAIRRRLSSMMCAAGQCAREAKVITQRKKGFVQQRTKLSLVMLPTAIQGCVA